MIVLAAAIGEPYAPCITSLLACRVNGERMPPIYPPHRRSPAEFGRLTKKAAREPRGDQPERLPMSSIKQATGLFQPRYDSIAYAPGRSDGHVKGLARIVRAGRDLDPVTVVALGNEWFLVDGHHRLAAYAEAGRGGDYAVPVRIENSDLRGQARLDWAIALSFADNQKSRLNISDADKADGAWRAVASGAEGSKRDLAATFGVSESTIANMRRVCGEIEEAGGDQHMLMSWRSAKLELARLQGTGQASDPEYAEKRKRIVAKHLRPVMDMGLAPGELAEALEAYSPGIVDQMALARNADEEEDDQELSAII